MDITTIPWGTISLIALAIFAVVASWLERRSRNIGGHGTTIAILDGTKVNIQSNAKVSVMVRGGGGGGGGGSGPAVSCGASSRIKKTFGTYKPKNNN